MQRVSEQFHETSTWNSVEFRGPFAKIREVDTYPKPEKHESNTNSVNVNPRKNTTNLHRTRIKPEFGFTDAHEMST